MISFRNDYGEVAHPRILERLLECAYAQNDGYGLDVHSVAAADSIRRLLGRDADIHFIPGGTQTNLLVIAACLRPFECVLTCNTGHINVHETGAIEATGHKVVTVPHVDGKLTPEGIRTMFDAHESEHMVKPRMVYLSDSTELGTVYTKTELTAIRRTCDELGLLLFLDGARLGSALCSAQNDLTLSDLAALCDLFYIGGTKNGALFGEALVIINDALKADFRYMIKNRGAMLAKGFVTGIQFEVLFEGENPLFFELAAHANSQAIKIADALMAKGYDFYATPSGSNQLFPIVTAEKMAELEQNFAFNVEKTLPDGRFAIRFVTSFATTDKMVDALIEAL
ncbi:MAG: aminotransferase class I/II-fold pyridoxal phosphate-dependent enzyme [Clostridia bacterium]|nr:aminotransferase class I/II-fold pyridoxal phosphate-dependent enzyme [Clostridia bacterium]